MSEFKTPEERSAEFVREIETKVKLAYRKYKENQTNANLEEYRTGEKLLTSSMKQHKRAFKHSTLRQISNVEQIDADVRVLDKEVVTYLDHKSAEPNIN